MTRVELLPDGQAPLLDRYQIIGRISSGGMGVVWLGRLGGVGGFQRLVAIKQLHPHLARESEFVEMFLDEARLAAGIHHHHVVSILEVGTADGGYYLVMEYIEGASLSEVNTRAAALGRTVPQEVILRVVLDSLSGLHAAHELCDQQGKPLGLVHRDCTPQNILLGLDGCVKITDFGIARASARLATTREGAFKGKLAYMAPEQTQGDDIDRRADLFSVGVILWEALTNRRLFKGKTDAQTLTRLLNMPIPRVRDVAPDVHPQLDAVCSRSLERDPVLRFQTAEEMADALERAARAASNGRDDQISTVRALSAYLGDLLGQEITSQRESVRVWLARAENTPPPRTGPGSSQRPPTSHMPAPTLRGWPAAGETGSHPPGMVEPLVPMSESGEDEVTLREQVSAVLERPAPEPVVSSARAPATVPTPAPRGSTSNRPSAPPSSAQLTALPTTTPAPVGAAGVSAGPTLASGAAFVAIPPGAQAMPAPAVSLGLAPSSASPDGLAISPAPSTMHPAGLPSKSSWGRLGLAAIAAILLGGVVMVVGRGTLWGGAGTPAPDGTVVSGGVASGGPTPTVVPTPSTASPTTPPPDDPSTSTASTSAGPATASTTAAAPHHGGSASTSTSTARAPAEPTGEAPTAKPKATATPSSASDIDGLKNPYR